MKFLDLFRITDFISDIEKKIETVEINQNLQTEKITQVLQDIEDLKKRIVFLEGQLTQVSKYFSAVPIHNEIDKEGPEEVEVDENYRIPIVPGINFRYEGEPESSTRPIGIDYGDYTAGRPGRLHKQKANNRRSKT